MKILHVCAGWQRWNGAANIARMIIDEQCREGHEVTFVTWAKIRDLRAADEVWIHCGWLPCLWWAAFWARNARWMPEACYDPIRLKFSAWKKCLVGPIERWALRRCRKIVATCDAEKAWIGAYLGKRCPKIVVEDIKRFFKLGVGKGDCLDYKVESFEPRGEMHEEELRTRNLHLLYLGRRHPLKGVEYLEEAVSQLNFPNSPMLKIVSNAFGEEKERVWEWCDVLVLPTLSENFGLVVAEALERGKRVITTDGAPAWGDGNDYGGRLVYLKGYRGACDEARVSLLKEALKVMLSN